MYPLPPGDESGPVVTLRNIGVRRERTGVACRAGKVHATPGYQAGRARYQARRVHRVWRC